MVCDSKMLQSGRRFCRALNPEAVKMRYFAGNGRTGGGWKFPLTALSILKTSVFVFLFIFTGFDYNYHEPGKL